MEARLSANVAHNAAGRDAQVYKLQQTQHWLWQKHAWAHLRVRRTIDVQAGQRYYAPPDDLDIDRIFRIEVRYGQEWCELAPGIGSAEYSAYDSDLDIRSWPVERWQIFEDDMIELWPVPADDADPTTLEGRLRLTGIRKLRPFIADDDVCDLDGDLIVLHAAASHLAASKAEDRQLVIDKAKDLELRLVGNLSKKSTFGLFRKTQPAPYKGAQLPRVHYRQT